jgi:hypothetical protein
MAKKSAETVTAEIVAMLYEVKANEWTIQEKGVFLAAVKLQLAERSKPPGQKP